MGVDSYVLRSEFVIHHHTKETGEKWDPWQNSKLKTTVDLKEHKGLSHISQKKHNKSILWTDDTKLNF